MTYRVNRGWATKKVIEFVLFDPAELGIYEFVHFLKKERKKMWLWWIASATVAALTIYAFITLIVQPLLLLRFYDRQGIRGPPWRPLIGNLPEVFKQRNAEDGFHASFTSAAEEYGRVSIYWLGPDIRLRTLDAGVARALLSGPTAAARLHKPDLMRVTLGRLLGVGLVTSEGALHRAHRAMISPAFSWLRLQAFAPLMARAADGAVRRWHSAAAASADGRTHVDMHVEMSAATLEIIGQAAFGTDVGGDDQTKTVYEAAEELLRRLLDLVVSGIALFPWLLALPLPAVRAIDRRAAEVKAVAMGMIARRRAARASSTAASAGGVAADGLLIDALLDAVDESSGVGGSGGGGGGSGGSKRTGFTDAEVLDHAITFLMAGHETTAQAMCWTLYLLDSAEGRPWRASARAQVLAVCGRTRMPAIADLESIPLLGHIVAEAMRLYPPVPYIARTAVADFDLPYAEAAGGMLRVSAGTSFVIPIAALHRDADHWEAPHAFRPDRWAHGPSAATRSGDAFAYLPFSHGTRNCIGSQFALLEAKLILARMLQMCDWALDSDAYVHKPQMSVTLRPAHGMPMWVWPLPAAEAAGEAPDLGAKSHLREELK